MQAKLAFGRSSICATLPDRFSYLTLDARSAHPIADVDRDLNRSLEKPIASPALKELARNKKSAAISICDITRPAPNSQTLPPILKCLEGAGIPSEAITILIATGLHRAATKPEIVDICGSDVASQYRIVNHDARDLASHRHLGTTANGTPIYIYPAPRSSIPARSTQARIISGVTLPARLTSPVLRSTTPAASRRPIARPAPCTVE